MTEASATRPLSTPAAGSHTQGAQGSTLPLADQETRGEAGSPLLDLSFPVEGMTCASCVGRVERVLSRVPGVHEVHVNLAVERADLRAESSVSREALSVAVEKAGYKLGDERRPALARTPDSAHPQEHSDMQAHSHTHAHSHETERARLGRKAWVAAVLSLPVFLLEMGGHLIPGFHSWVMQSLGHEMTWHLELLLTLGVVFGPGLGIVTHGYRNLFAGAPEMNSLVAIGTTAALGSSLAATFAPELFADTHRNVYYEAASVVLTLVLVGRYLEARAKGRASEAISRLIRLTPEVATVRRDGQWLEVPAAEVHEGDELLMKPGQRFAVDGVVLEGESRVDEAMLTGEPHPVRKSPSAKVSAGTVNQSGTLVFRATEVGDKTLLAQIVRLVENAQATKLPIQALVDRVTFVFVPVVLGVAVLTLGAWFFLRPDLGFAFALINAASVLIVACPCAMGLATPVSILVASGRGAELGLLFRHGSALERLQKVKVIAFDKTGTLTLGRPELTDFFPSAEFSRDLLLPWLGALEARSEHPIARAIARAPEVEGVRLPEVRNFQVDVGLGISGDVQGRAIRIGSPRYLEQHGVELGPVSETLKMLQAAGKTGLAMAVDGRLAAAFAVSDPIRPDARKAVSALHSMGLAAVMISGDSRATARAVAQSLGIDEVVAEVSPGGKVQAVQELKAKHGIVAFVGDGINDAPVLAEADVGLAMGGGTDIAIEAAQVVLVKGNLDGVPQAVGLSRATLRNIRQNLVWAFGYNVLLVPLAAGALYPSLGLLFSPVMAALAMALSSVFVVTNALRLRRFAHERAGASVARAALTEKGAPA